MAAPHDLHQRVAVVEVKVSTLTDITRRLQRVEWMVAVAIGSGLLNLVKGCL